MDWEEVARTEARAWEAWRSPLFSMSTTPTGPLPALAAPAAVCSRSVGRGACRAPTEPKAAEFPGRKRACPHPAPESAAGPQSHSRPSSRPTAGPNPASCPANRASTGCPPPSRRRAQPAAQPVPGGEPEPVGGGPVGPDPDPGLGAARHAAVARAPAALRPAAAHGGDGTVRGVPAAPATRRSRRRAPRRGGPPAGPAPRRGRAHCPAPCGQGERPERASAEHKLPQGASSRGGASAARLAPCLAPAAAGQRRAAGEHRRECCPAREWRRRRGRDRRGRCLHRRRPPRRRERGEAAPAACGGGVWCRSGATGDGGGV